MGESLAQTLNTEGVIERQSFTTYFTRPVFLGKVAVWLVALLAFGYPLFASLSVFIGLPSRVVNIGTRGVYLGMALFLLVAAVFKKATYRFHWVNIFVLLFWLAYSLRLIYDFEVAGITSNDAEKSQIYLFAFGSALIPTLAFMATARYVSRLYLEWVVGLVLVAVNVAIVAVTLYKFGLNPALFAERLIINNATGDGMLINPITISMSGGQLILLSLGSLLMGGQWQGWWRWLYAPCLLFGFFNLIAGGSRAPIILTLLLSAYLVGFYFLKTHRFHRFIPNAKAAIIAVLVSIGIVYVVGLTRHIDLAAIERLLSFSTERGVGAKEERDYEFAAAWHDFLESPLIGRHFVNSYDFVYPHNIFLEVLMALGVLGAVLLYPFLAVLVLKLIRIPWQQPATFSIGLVFLITFLLTLTSGSLWASSYFWITATLWVNMPQENFST